LINTSNIMQHINPEDRHESILCAFTVKWNLG